MLYVVCIIKHMPWEPLMFVVKIHKNLIAKQAKKFYSVVQPKRRNKCATNNYTNQPYNLC